MTELHRCAAYLAVVLSSLITGCRCQCGTGSDGILALRAVTRDTKSFYSPDYPDHYPNNRECQWKLYTTPGYVIHVHVVWMALEESYDCRYDAITFYDGRTSEHDKIRRICSDQVRDFYSSTNYMVVKFESDFSIKGDGFQLEYTAIRRSQVPATVPPSFIWPYPGDTTVRTTTTSASNDRQNWPNYNIAALVGGLTGGLVLLFVLCALARYYFGHYCSSGRRQTARPYPPPSAPPPAHPTSTIYHNNNAVFMVSSSSAGHPLHPHHHGGATNLAFSPHGEAPPAYFSIQHSTTVVQPGGGTTAVMGAFCPPPPSYSEAMQFTHPPALTSASVPPPPFPRDVVGPQVVMPPIRTPSSMLPTPGDAAAAPADQPTMMPPFRRTISTPPVVGEAPAGSSSPPVMVPSLRTTTSSLQGPADVMGTPACPPTVMRPVQTASAAVFSPPHQDTTVHPTIMPSSQTASEAIPAPPAYIVRNGSSSVEE